MVNQTLKKLPLIISAAIYSALTLNAGLVYSAGIVADGSTATTVTTVNQVHIVDIATPTAGGVSQNRFDRFSIDNNGAIMNNSTLDGTSNLAGQVQANSNLSAGSASIILNEVTSNRQSNLNGVTEIFGDNARYNLQADNNVLIAAAQQLSETEAQSSQSGFFNNGDIYKRNEQRRASQFNQTMGSRLSAANNLNLTAGRAKVVGSSVLAGNTLNVKTDVGDIELLAAASRESGYEYEKSVRVGLGDMVNNLGRPDKWFKLENGRATLTLTEAQYDESETTTVTTTQQGSVLQAGTITLDAAGDITAEGATLLAKANNDPSETRLGDINLTAKGDITLGSASNRTQTNSNTLSGKADLSIVVQNQAIEVGNAIKAVDKAKKQLKQAREDYRQYEKDLKKQKTALAQLEQRYQNNEAGIGQDDIQELRDFIQLAKSDNDGYQAGIAAAALNLSSQGTLLIQQLGAASQSFLTYGFNAGVQLDINASKTTDTQTQNTAIASILQGRNISLNNQGDTTLTGSQLLASNDLNIATRNLSVFADTNTAKQTNKNQQGTVTIAQTVYGTAGGPTVNASYAQNQAQTKTITAINAQLRGKNITLTTQENALFRGATVQAEDTLVASIGGDLTLESVQSITQSNNKGASLSGGFGFGATEQQANNAKTIRNSINNLGQSSKKVSSVNAGLGVNRGRSLNRQTEVTRLTAGNRAEITVKGRTQLKGALLATVDENNNDLGNLNLTTGRFGFEDMSNARFNTNKNIGLSSSIGIGEKDKTTSTRTANNENTPANKATNNKLNTTKVQYANSTGYTKTKTLATLGSGNIQITNSDDANNLDRLNRDTTKTNKDIFNTQRQQGNIDLTIDTRLFSKKGNNEIKTDLKRIGVVGQALAVLGDDSVSFLGNRAGGKTSFREQVMSRQDYLSAVLTFSSNKKNKKYIETLTNGEASAKDKQLAYTELAKSVAVQLDIPIAKAKIILKQDGTLIKGAYSKETNEIFVMDNFNATTGEAVNTVGNEVAHHADAMRDGNAAFTQTKVYKDNRDRYSDIMGDALEDYTSFAFAMNGYDSLTAVNEQSSSRGALGRPVAFIQRNNALFNSLDLNQIEYRQFNYNEAKILDQARYKIKALNLSPQANELTVALLEASGCAKVRCADNVPTGDLKYRQLKQLQDYGDTLAENSFDTLMSQLGVDTKYKVQVRGQASRNGRTRTKQGFEYSASDRTSDLAQAKTGDWIEAAQEIVQGGYEFTVFAGAETFSNIYSTENTEGFANYMAQQTSKTWTDAETSSIGQTEGRRVGSWGRRVGSYKSHFLKT